MPTCRISVSLKSSTWPHVCINPCSFTTEVAKVFSLLLPRTMATFTYDHSIESPTPNISQVFGFSHEGFYLALGDSVDRRVYIIETDLRVVTCIPVVGPPTSLVWDSIDTKQFVVGFNDGRLSLCSFRSIHLSETRFNVLEGRGAVTSLALTRDGLTLAVAVSNGDVVIFKRKSPSSMFLLVFAPRLNPDIHLSFFHTDHQRHLGIQSPIR